jgi:putative intracellular protease/amidase
MKNLGLWIGILLILSIASGVFGQAPPAPAKPTVGILIFDNVQIIDYTGPYEVFAGRGYKVVTIAPEKKMITTIGNMKVMPDFDYLDAPKLDILVIPGGGRSDINKLEGVWKTAPLPMKDTPQTTKWIQDQAESARFVLSVCNGAFTLARAGLLENKSATTTMPFLSKLKEVSPTTNVVLDKRWTDNGKILTSGGLSAGIDAALHVVEKIEGHGKAQDAALGMEYKWDDAGSYASFALARKYAMFGFEFEGLSLKREGDEDHWENSWLISKPTTAAEILEVVNKPLSDSENTMFGPVKVKWERQNGSAANTSRWSFTDEKGQSWLGFVSVTPSPTEKDKFIFSIRVARKDSEFAKLFQ